MEGLLAFFNTAYMPHGHCFLWLPSILWLSVGSDLLISLSYFSIPIAILIFLKKRSDLQLKRVAVLLASFILLCGITHLISIYNIWYGAYGLAAIFKAATAAVSVATAIVVYLSIGPALAIPTASEMESAVRENLAKEREIESLKVQRHFDVLFKAVVDFMPAGVLVLDQDYRVLIVNDELERIFGYSQGELNGKPLDVLLPSEQRSAHKMLVENFSSAEPSDQLMARGRVVQGLHVDGSLVGVEVNLSPQNVEGKQYVIASVIAVDQVINERSAFLARSGRLMRAINAAEEGIWEWNVQLNEVWFSQQLLELIGLDRAVEEYSFDDWLNHIHPDDRSKVQNVLHNHLEHRSPFVVEYRGKNLSGAYHWVQMRGEASRNGQGKPLLMSGTLVDVEKTVELSQQLDEQLDKNEALSKDFINTFELAAVGIAHVALDGRWMRVNERLCGIVGYQASELINLTFQDITYEDDLEADLENVRQLLDGERDTYAMEKRYITKSREIIWVNLTVSIVREEDKESGELVPKHFISVIEDISKRKRIESDLAASNAELERFAYSASHDLQEPLRKITMFSESLKARLVGRLQDGEAEYELGRIANAAARMKAMVSALMELSRAGRSELTLKEFSVASLIHDAVEQLEALTRESNANIRTQGDVKIEADYAALVHVFQNLITNSIRYAKPEEAPQMEIEIKLQSKQVCVSVRDNAMGIPAELREAAFEPFRRFVDKSVSGSGMGLAICRRIIERHHGSIKVVDSEIDGTEFEVVLPLKQMNSAINSA